MKHMKIAKLSIILIMAFLFAGCSVRVTDFTVLSTKNVEWSRAATFTKGKTRVEGTDVAHIIIFIPTGAPNMKEAVDRAIESVPGAVALVDGVVTVNNFYIPLLYGQSSYVVEGTPLIDSKAMGAVSKDSFLLSYLDKNGKLVKTNPVSKEEYNNVLNNLPGNSKF